MVPAVTNTGINVVSTNLILENETDPVIWRGPVIAGVVKQFWKDTVWNNIDYMFVDMPRVQEMFRLQFSSQYLLTEL